MECNKEEAVRAKGIAEKKMLNKDFNGAQKIVLKAQKLFPDLENVSQMQTVCDVHLAAEVKVNGEMNWYGILQVMQTADDITIKKQYRRLALLLHPDKNKFGGAEAAFKLVAEAHRTLADRAKRALHDMKIGGNFRSVSAMQPAPHPNKTSYTKKQPEAAGTFSNTTSAQSNVFSQQQPAPFSTTQTFWTMCPSCGVRYQYYKNMLNKSLCCQCCKKPFVAYALNEYAMPSAAPLNSTGAHRQEEQIPTSHYAGQQRNFDSHIGSEGIAKSRSSPNNLKEDVNDSGTATDAKFGKEKPPELNKKEQAVKPPSRNRCQKRGRKIAVESSESKSSDSNGVVGDGYPPAENTGTAGSYQQKSARKKQSVSYNEEKNADDDLPSPNKKSRTELNDLKSWEGDANNANVQTSEAAAAATCEKDSKVEGGASSTSLANGLQGRKQGRSDNDFNSGVSQDPDPLSYPDPEFCDFEKERDESNFAVDQIWAIYDNLDAMPRYYALIRHVYGPKFKLRFTWLEYDPKGKAETVWFEGGLPIGCGSFRLGRSQRTTDERLMFSHLMPWSKGTKKNTYNIFPRKREVWALFKNWDIEWSSCVDKERHYEYEIVEVLSDLTEGDAICVVRLVKIQGFVSLFVQSSDKESSPLKIPMKDILRFSHKIPSHRMIGNEREGIPKGSLELDCVSLPSNFAEMFSSVTLDSFKARVEDLDNTCNGLNPDSAINKEAVPTSTAKMSNVSNDKEEATCKEEPNHPVMTKNADVGSENQAECEQNADCYEYPESEFHIFDEERSASKFEVGQIWALYSDVDKNPNYYGRISKVESDRFRVHVTWLTAYTEHDRERHWLGEPLPVGCGTFKIIRDTSTYDTTDTFSHIVHANPTVRKNHYVLYPCVGEIWAVYRNWSLEWSLSDLDNCEYDIVEILDAYGSGFIVLVLSKVNGYRAVFRGDGSGISAKTMNIPYAERLKFSHKIPAFRLTEERGGKLRGYWELDPASVPELFLFTNSD